MSDNMNPYASTQVDMDGQKPAIAQGIITESMVTYLKQASPWIRFYAIYGFVQAGTAILGGIVFAFMAPLFNSLLAADSADMLDGTTKALISGMFGGSGFIIIAVGVFVIIPMKFLYNFGSKIREFVQTHNDKALELALRNNKSYWKFLGIITIVSLAAIPVMFVIFMIIGISSYFM